MQKNRQRQSRLSWIVFLPVMLFALTFSASGQDHTATVTEDLGNDQFIAVFGGKEYRMINAAKAVELAKQKVELETLRANEVRYQDLIKIADQNVLIAHQQRELERQNFVHAMSLYEKERELRMASQQFLPHGKVGGFGGKVLSAMDSVWFQGFIKAAVPIYTAWRTSKQ